MEDLGTTSSSARFDFSNPWFSATIIAGDGTKFPLWTKFDGGTSADKIATQGDLERAGLKGTKALSFLQELVIENNLAQAPKITATLSPPYLDAINFLDSKLLEWGKSRIEVVYGYISNTTNEVCVSTVFGGVLQKPDIQLGVDVVITLNAQGLSSFSATRQSGTRTFKNNTRKEIIEAIAHGRTAKPLRLESTDLGPLKGGDITKFAVALGSDARFKLTSQFSNLAPLKLNFVNRPSRLSLGDPTLTLLGESTREVEIVDEAVLKDKESNRLYDIDKISYTQGGRTDWQAIDILTRQCQCYALWIGSKLVLLPVDGVMGGGVKRYFRLYGFPGGRIGPGSGVFPILSVSSPSMQLWAPGQSRGVFQQDQNSKTRKTEKRYTGDKETNITRTSEGVSTLEASSIMPAHDENTGDGASFFAGAPSDPTAHAEAKAEFRGSANNMGAVLTIESFADPRLKPGDKIGVRGLGFRFDEGTYAIHKQTITIGTGGATMSLEVISNTAGIVGVKAKGAVAANPDPKPVDSKLVVEANVEGNDAEFDAFLLQDLAGF